MAAAPEILVSPRSGDSYNAHSYHTKVPPNAIAQLISRHLPNGGVVADPYCGSGTTGVAAAIAESLLPDGSRYDVILGDLSPYAAFIAKELNVAPDDCVFDEAVRECVQLAEREIGRFWRTTHSDGRSGRVLHTVWSELLICPECDRRFRYWDAAVDLQRGELRRSISCACGQSLRKDECERASERRFDPFIGEWVESTVREPVAITYEVDGERHTKQPDAEDLRTYQECAQLTAPDCCPKRLMLNRAGPWGDLYRGGYHRGITHVHHFYTWRNFLTVGHLWQAAAETDAHEAVRLLISSYNLAHSTLMTRMVFKRTSTKPVLTGYQTGTLYISSLPVEKNPLVGIVRSKQRALKRAFDVVRSRRGKVQVLAAAAQSWSGVGKTIDYAFVDPPFGANIPYSEANFIAEAWLGEFTDQSREASISRAQGKSAEDYSNLLAEGFASLRERMSARARMTVMFHSASSAPWDALMRALEQAGFSTHEVLLLDKGQASFKQVRADGAVQGDLLIETRPRRRRSPAARRTQQSRLTTREVADEALTLWLERALDSRESPLDTKTERLLFSRFIADQVSAGRPVPVSAARFYASARALMEVQRVPAPVS
jgi:hypothetical protein